MLTRNEILDWLGADDPERLERLWQRADEVRRRCVGEQVHLRGLIEFSNHCRRHCGYCGLRAGNAALPRYRMSEAEIVACAHAAVGCGYGTVVLQSGEDDGLSADWLARIVRRIKAETPLAVTLSVGERGEDELRSWRQAGADRYLLRFETSNRRLYRRIHPPWPGAGNDRLEQLKLLRRLGYQIGSGVMIGIPGQSHEDLAADIELFAALELDMIGVGPFLPHPNTPLGGAHAPAGLSPDPPDAAKTDGPHSPGAAAAFARQAPNSELMTYKVMALTRLACPGANIPSTTALAAVNPAAGWELGLARGANVIMPNLTPPTYRALYEIYPAKASVPETAGRTGGCIRRRIETVGRRPGIGRGDPIRISREAKARERVPGT